MRRKKADILVFEHDPLLFDLLNFEAITSKAPLSLSHVQNDVDALAMLAKKPYDAILVELDWPWMRGLIRAYTIREAGYKTLIIGKMCHEMCCDREAYRKFGIDAFIHADSPTRLKDTVAVLEGYKGKGSEIK